MHRFRGILLSGLVALLMVGIVTADEGVSVPGNTVDLPIGGYLGAWVDRECFDSEDQRCLKFWVTLDVGRIISWL